MKSIDERSDSNNNASTSNPSIVCDGVIAFNDTDEIMYWAIYTLDGTRLYISEVQESEYRFELNLSSLGVKNWTELVLAAIAPDGTIIMSDIILQVYSFTSNEAYFEFLEISGSYVVQQYGVWDYKIVNNEVTITGYTGLDSKLVMPETIQYLPVTAIESFAFQGNDILKTINTTNVKTIGDFAFASCELLESVTMSKVETLDVGIFYDCLTLEKVDLPLANFVGSRCFEGCTALQVIHLPSVITIDEFAFFQSGINYVDIPSVESIYTQSFSHCEYFKDLNISKNLITVGLNVFLGSKVENISIDYGTEDVTNVTLATWNTFASMLTELDLSNVTGKFVLNTSIVKDVANTLIYSYNGNTLTATSYKGKTSNLVLPDYINGKEVTSIGSFVFSELSSLVSITMPNVTSIGKEAFVHCSSLKNVIGYKLTSIGYDGFNNCPLLESITIPCVTFIDSFAFAYCSKLTSIELKVISRLSSPTFYYCSTLQKVVISKNVVVDFSDFRGCPINSLTIYYGTEDISTVTINDWNNFVKYLGLNPEQIPGKYVMNTTETRNFNDTTPPIIMLLGNNPMTVEVNTSYVEPGAIVTDNVNTNLQAVITGSVDTTKIGVNYIHYNATDLSGNKATEVIRTVNVIDTTAPVITLNGDNPMTVEVNTPYIEPGAIVTDNVDTNLQAVITGSVDTTKLGVNYIHYNASDLSGNKATEVIRTVNVVDTTSPVIILNGTNPMVVEINTAYIEPGAVVTDNVDTNLQAVITGSVDTTKFGENYIYYNATDSSGNKATEVVRTVKVTDTIAPTIMLNGYYEVYLEINTPYIEEGAVVTDNFDTNLQVVITGVVNTSIAGEYHVYYNATDSSGNKAIEVIRTVFVRDPIDDFCYTISNNEVTITCYSGRDHNVIIPETIEGLPVTTIDSYAFTSSPSILSINTSNVTTINDFAFKYCDSLTTVIMPEVKVIKEYGLASCKNLRFVGMPNVTDIGDMAIANCTTLKSINISKNLTSIGIGIFSGSTLENLTIDYGTEDISKITIYNWNEFVSKLTGWDLTTVPGKYVKNNLYTEDIVNRLTYKEYTSYLKVSDYSGTVVDLKLPEAINLKPVTAIDSYAFRSASSLNSINVSSVTNIGMFAFFACVKLTSVIGKKVTTLGVSALQGCNKLTSLTLPELTTIDQGSFAYLISLTSISFPKLTTVKGDGAFASCNMLQSIDLPVLTTTANYTFPACISLTEINIPSVTSIGKGMFALCSELQEVDLSKVTKIKDYAYYYCIMLNKVTISKDATTGAGVFIGCPISNVTIYYGTEDISGVTIDDWNAFVTNMGLVPASIPGKYVMNDYGIRDLA